MEFIIDTREPNEIFKIADREGISYKKQALRAADFAIIDGERNLVGVERKKVNDLIQSLFKKKGEEAARFWLQVEKMRMYEHRFLIIVGSLQRFETKLKKYGKNLNPNVIYGVLASIAVRENWNVIWVPNNTFCVQVAHRICTKIYEGKFNNPIVASKTRNHFLRQIPGIDMTKAKHLERAFPNLTAIANAERDELEKIKGIGKVNARRIYEYFHNGW